MQLQKVFPSCSSFSISVLEFFYPRARRPSSRHLSLNARSSTRPQARLSDAFLPCRHCAICPSPGAMFAQCFSISFQQASATSSIRSNVRCRLREASKMARSQPALTLSSWACMQRIRRPSPGVTEPQYFWTSALQAFCTFSTAAVTRALRLAGACAEAPVHIVAAYTATANEGDVERSWRVLPWCFKSQKNSRSSAAPPAAAASTTPVRPRLDALHLHGDEPSGLRLHNHPGA